MLRRLCDWVRPAFWKDKAGNITILFGLSLLPVMFSIGAAVDYGRAYSAQQRFSHAIDAAALAVGSTANLNNQQIKELAQAYMDANYPPGEIGATSTITVTSDQAKVTVNVSGYVKTTFLGAAGIKQIDVGAHVEVTRTLKNIELVMALDNTGSMGWNGKIGALKTAANTMLDILMPDAQNSANGDVKIGLVPFAAAVNIGADKLNSGWIDTSAQSGVAWEDFADGTNALTLYDQILNRAWNGCVRARVAPYDTSDTGPSGATPGTLWAPYFAPDEPDTGSYANKYASDTGYSGASNDYDARQRYTGKYVNYSIEGGSDGPDFNCTVPEVTPLTAIRGEVQSGIATMIASGSTVVPAGLAWGWRLISPSAPFIEGVAYDDDKTVKAIVLLTDGQNSVGGGQGNHNGSYYSAYGFAQSGHLGATSGSQAEAALDAKTAALCENIKAEGIVLYTITFQLNDGPIKDLMRNCASSTAMYYDSPSNEQLQNVFEQIAIGLSDLRISK